MTKPSNLTAIEKATNRSWDDWLKLLESFEARELDHTAITKKLHELTDVDGWWIQSVTVAYEQHIGRRLPGQVKDGTFETTASKTTAGSMDDVMAKWIELVDQQADFNGIGVVESSASETDKWRNWRAKLADGTRVVVGIYQKSPDKAVLGLAHQKIVDAKTADTWRNYWKQLFEQL